MTTMAEVIADHEKCYYSVLGTWRCVCGEHLKVYSDAVTAQFAHMEQQLQAHGFGHVPTALNEAADALSVDGVGFFRGGCGSNPIDQAKLEGISKSITWLRARAAETGGTE